MGKLEALKNLVADMFAKSENKADLEQLAAIQNACDEVEVEHNQLQAENKELMKDYKELIKHTSFKDPNNKPSETIGGRSGSSIDDALQQAIKEFKK